MFRNRFKIKKQGRSEAQTLSNGFDAFELRLGDLMRGERATRRLSLLDVQRQLKIKAAYIAAIENCDVTAFETPGFIAGYVRSYARFLNMDPDWAFEEFCKESGFVAAASTGVNHLNESKSNSLQSIKGSTFDSVDKADVRRRSLAIIKVVFFGLAYPILIVIDAFNSIVSALSNREPGETHSFKSVSPKTSDWWSFLAVCAGTVFGGLFYL